MKGFFKFKERGTDLKTEIIAAFAITFVLPTIQSLVAGG